MGQIQGTTGNNKTSKDLARYHHAKSALAKSEKLEIMSFKMPQPSLIEASAGTGKTYTITNLVLRALLGLGKTTTALERPLQIDELLVVTFTNAATSDLRKRIYERIRSARCALEQFVQQVIYLALQNDESVSLRERATFGTSANLGDDAVDADDKELGSGLLSAIEDADDKEAGSMLPSPEDGSDEDSSLSSSFERDSFDLADLSPDELKDLHVRLDLDAIFSSLSFSEIDKAIVSELLERKTVALRDAILILGRAERKINNAAICTIHSFCNSILTQVYALESGEAFNTELKTDLSSERREAFFGLWRRLFYKKDSSSALLMALNAHDPIKMISDIEKLSKVRVSDPNEGFFGYQLERFKPLLERYNCPIDPKSELDYETQLTNYIARFSVEVFKGNIRNLQPLLTFKKGLPISELEQFFDVHNQSFTERYVAAKISLRSTIKDSLTAIVDSYGMLETLNARGYKVLSDAKAEAHNRAHSAANGEVKSGAHNAAEANSEPLLDAIGAVNGSSISSGTFDLSNLSDDEIKILAADSDFVSLLTKLNENLFKMLPKKDEDCYTGKPKKSDEFAEISEFNNKLKFLRGQLKADLDSGNGGDAEGYMYLVRTLVAIALNREFERKCHELNVMSNDDVLHRLSYALNARGEHGDALAKLIRVRYPLAMIDEFQDTDPVQFNIFKAVYLNEQALQDHAYCYLIGDPKQSIYAFRGSDINSYLKAKNIIIELTNGNGLYTLDTNYRSSPDVVAASNAIFNDSIKKDNDNPFENEQIPFESVNSGLANNLESKLGKKAKDAVLSRDFYIQGLEQYMGFERIYSDEQELNGDEAAHADAAQAKADAANEDAVNSAHAQANNNADASVKADANGANAQANRDVAAVPLSEQVHQVGNLRFKGLANNYIVDLGEQEYSTKEKMHKAYAMVTAKLVQEILEHGRLVKDGKEIAVKASDIAILVSSGTQNDAIQAQLTALQIPSVYFSDRSSVLAKPRKQTFGNKESADSEPASEAIDLIYLMEAMCDFTKQSKVNKLLASRLLSLDGREYRRLSANPCFEDEVMLLSNCAQVWRQYGFMPAFLKWTNAHSVCTRLLKVEGGERRYTNYCHIGEIIQSVHKKNAGIEMQLHWFADLVNNGSDMFDEDVTKKRLESEQAQVKILTIHKSKGLEFPIVLMPFLWDFNKEDKGYIDYYNAAQYYNERVGKVVQDYAPNEPIDISALNENAENENAAKANKSDLEKPSHDDTSDDSSDDSSAACAKPRNLTPAQISVLEEDRESTRLLYVAITRARYANFMIVGNYLGSSKPSALPAMHASYDPYAGAGVKTPYTTKSFIESVEALPQYFTVLNGQKLVPELVEESVDGKESAEQEDNKAVEGVGIKGLDTGLNKNGLAASASTSASATEDAANEADSASWLSPVNTGTSAFNKNCPATFFDKLDVAPLAISFVYKGAINRDFNIYSYSSLTADSAKVNTNFEGEVEDVTDLSAEYEGEGAQYITANAKSNIAKSYESPESLQDGDSTICDATQSVSFLMQEHLDNGTYFKDSAFDVEITSSEAAKIASDVSSYQEDKTDTNIIAEYEGLIGDHGSFAESILADNLGAGAAHGGAYGAAHGADSFHDELGSQDEALGGFDAQNYAQDDGQDSSLDADDEHAAHAHDAAHANAAAISAGLNLEDEATSSGADSLDDAQDAVEEGAHERDLPAPLCHIFPRGKSPGDFMHVLLEQFDFKKIKEQGYQHYIKQEFFTKTNLELRLLSWTKFIKGARLAPEQACEQMALWLNDVVEAPIVTGKYHCLALSDLEAFSYEREMRFWLSSYKVSTEELDELCKDVAADIIVDKRVLQSVQSSLKLNRQELEGFANGSIDLACRFDLNSKLNLKARKDLVEALPEDMQAQFAEALQSAASTASLVGSNHGSAEGSDESDYKYFVIDYKTNALSKKITDARDMQRYLQNLNSHQAKATGKAKERYKAELKEQALEQYDKLYSSYDYQKLVASIYEHRYDVQFMLYTLALYRFLKCRFGISDEASDEELEAFYNKHIGGVIYLFLRGMKANYQRNEISPGVFITKLDFKHVKRLDEMLSQD